MTVTIGKKTRKQKKTHRNVKCDYGKFYGPFIEFMEFDSRGKQGNISQKP